jgi:hypothetical protein
MPKKKKKKISPRKVKKVRKMRTKKICKEIPKNIFGQKIEINKVPEVKEVVDVFEEKKYAELQKEEYLSSEIESEFEQGEQPKISELPKINQRRRLFITYASIFCIMAVIVSFWLLGIRNSLSQGLKNLNASEDTEEISSIFSDFKKSLDNVASYISGQGSQIEDFTQKAKNIIIEEKLKQDIANKIKVQIDGSISNSNLNINQ